MDLRRLRTLLDQARAATKTPSSTCRNPKSFKALGRISEISENHMAVSILYLYTGDSLGHAPRNDLQGWLTLGGHQQNAWYQGSFPTAWVRHQQNALWAYSRMSSCKSLTQNGCAGAKVAFSLCSQIATSCVPNCRSASLIYFR